MDKDEAKAGAQETSADQSKLQDDVESGSVSGHSIKSSRTAHSSRSSRSSHASHASASSRASIAAAKARAEAKAAEAKIAYAHEEMELKLEKVRLETRLDILQQKKEANAALVKAEVMEAAAAEIEMHGNLQHLEFIPIQSTRSRKLVNI